MAILSRAGVRRFKDIAADRYGTAEGLGEVTDLMLSSPDGERVDVSVLVYDSDNDLLAMPLGYLFPGERLQAVFDLLRIKEPLHELINGAVEHADVLVGFDDDGQPQLDFQRP